MNNSNQKRGISMNFSGVLGSLRKEVLNMVAIETVTKMLPLSAPGFFVLKNSHYREGGGFSIIDSVKITANEENEEYYILQDIG